MGKILILLFVLIQVTVIVPQLTEKQKCKINDTVCLVKSANELIPYFTAGIPELGIQSLDVMSVNEIKIDLSGLKIQMTDLKCKGLKKAVVENIQFNMDQKMLEMAYHSDINVKGKYVTTGRLFVLPVSGNGEVSIKLKNLYVTYKIPFTIKKNKDGKEVIELTDFKYDFVIKDNAHFEFSNLYNGNKVGSDLFHQFINNNWKDVANEFGRPTLQTPMTRIYEAIKTYLLSQPLENLALKD